MSSISNLDWDTMVAEYDGKLRWIFVTTFWFTDMLLVEWKTGFGG